MNDLTTQENAITELKQFILLIEQIAQKITSTPQNNLTPDFVRDQIGVINKTILPAKQNCDLLAETLNQENKNWKPITKIGNSKMTYLLRGTAVALKFKTQEGEELSTDLTNKSVILIGKWANGQWIHQHPNKIIGFEPLSFKELPSIID